MPWRVVARLSGPDEMIFFIGLSGDNGKIIVRSFLDERGRVASRRGCEWCDTRSPKSSRTRNEPRVESESSEREPFVRLSDRALPS